MGAGLLYAAIIVGWAAYLIPHALRRYDDVARARSIDRFSSAMRVLGRKPTEAVSTVEPSAAPPSPAYARPPHVRPPHAGAPHARSSHGAERAAARAAARRRRRVLGLLLLATLSTVGGSALALLPWWSVAVPASLAALFLGACARRARRESDAYWERVAPPAGPTTRSDSAYGSLLRDSRSTTDARPGADSDLAATGAGGDRTAMADDEPTVIIEREQEPQVAVTVETSDGGVLWDPVPVTLPTYVHKPKAHRTIRTIDLDQPGTWTSGNTEEASALADQAAEAPEETTGEDRRAVGS